MSGHIHGEGFCPACVEFGSVEGARHGARLGAEEASKAWEARVPAMLVEARAAMLERAADELREDWVKNGRHQGQPGCYSSGYEHWLRERAVLARQMPAAVREGGTERSGASGGSAVEVPVDVGPSDGRTGPPPPYPQPGTVGWDINPDCYLDPTCGEALGDMRCQLRRGHDGGHEDWSGVAVSRDLLGGVRPNPLDIAHQHMTEALKREHDA